MGAFRRATAIAIAGVLVTALLAVPVAQAGSQGISAERTQRMTQKAAKFYIARYLKQETGKYWRRGHDKKIVDCKNLSNIRVRCKVSWFYKRKLYIHGSMTAYYKRNDREHVFLREDLKVRAI